MSYMQTSSGAIASAQQITQKNIQMTQVQTGQSIVPANQPGANALANPAPQTQITQVVIQENTVIQPVYVVAVQQAPKHYEKIKLPGDDWYIYRGVCVT